MKIIYLEEKMKKILKNKRKKLKVKINMRKKVN